MKLINTQGYLLFIDEKAEIKEDDYYVNTQNKPYVNISGATRFNGLYDKCYKILAYCPLTKDAKELDLPILPNPFKEVDVMKLAQSSWNENKEKKGHYSKKDINEQISMSGGYICGFEEGYKTAQAKGQYSLEDMISFAEYVGNYYTDIHKPVIPTEELLNSFIQSLSTQQLPKEFILEMRKISKYSYIDNYGRECFTFKGLLEGDIIISNKTQEGIGGDFIPFPMSLIKENKEYLIKEISSFGFYTVPWIIDEDGNHTIPDFDLFRVKGDERFKTITNLEGKQELVGTYKY